MHEEVWIGKYIQFGLICFFTSLISRWMRTMIKMVWCEAGCNCTPDICQGVMCQLENTSRRSEQIPGPAINIRSRLTDIVSIVTGSHMDVDFNIIDWCLHFMFHREMWKQLEPDDWPRFGEKHYQYLEISSSHFEWTRGIQVHFSISLRRATQDVLLAFWVCV